MSFRPTISVYVGGEIADIWYCRNWYETSLLFQAVSIAERYDGCATVRDYFVRAYGAAEADRRLEPAERAEDVESMKWLEECSELPLLVDLTAGCIYCSCGALSDGELAAVPSMLEAEDEYGWPLRIGPETDYYSLLRSCRLPYRELDMDVIRPLLDELRQ